MRIENIIESDICQLVEMGRQAHAESKYKHLKYSEKQVAATFREHILGDAIAIKAMSENTLIGFLMAAKTEFIFTEEPIILETCYYILPEYRGGKCFLFMMKEFNKWSKDTPQFCLPHFKIDNSKTYSALEKMGFSEAGRMYSRNL